MRSLAIILSIFALSLTQSTAFLPYYGDELTKEELLEIRPLVWRSIRHLNNESDEPFYWKLKHMIHAFKDESRGRYMFLMNIYRSDCIKQKDQLRISLNNCSAPNNSPSETCVHYVIPGHDNLGELHFTSYCNSATNAGRNVRNNLNLEKRGKEQEDKYKFNSDRRIGKIMKQTRLAIASDDASLWNLFSDFVDRYSKNYETKQEALRRFLTYKSNFYHVKMLQENELGTAIYGETQFMDMAIDEFERLYLPYKWEQPQYEVNQIDEFSPLFDVDEDIPASIDWRKKGVVTSVKNQESCGSCWAFSVTGNIEGQWALKKGKLMSLSEQELLDCDIVDQGCNGGLPLNAYKEIIRLGGLEPENIYPYDARKENCHIERSEFAAYINKSVQLPQDESKMAIWLFKNGPISIGINAYPLQFYRHGISHPWKISCSPLMLNHGVLIVGYGEESGKPFWIIKNSWGARWGENGYYRLYRGKNVCGVNEMATSAIIY